MDILLVCCWWLVKGVARPPMLCVAQNHRLQAHRHCCLTWIFCVKWNMRDMGLPYVTEHYKSIFLTRFANLMVFERDKSPKIYHILFQSVRDAQWRPLRVPEQSGLVSCGHWMMPML